MALLFIPYHPLAIEVIIDLLPLVKIHHLIVPQLIPKHLINSISFLQLILGNLDLPKFVSLKVEISLVYDIPAYWLFFALVWLHFARVGGQPRIVVKVRDGLAPNKAGLTVHQFKLDQRELGRGGRNLRDLE